MKFTGFGRGIVDKINSWQLPEPIVDALKRRMTPLVGAYHGELEFDDDGMCFAIRFQDPRGSEHWFSFDLRLKRRDDEFWVWDINGYELNDEYDVVWESDPTPL